MNAIYQPVGPNYFAADLLRYFFHGRQWYCGQPLLTPLW